MVRNRPVGYTLQSAEVPCLDWRDPVIPVGDSAPSRRTPWVNYTLIILTILAFLFELALGPSLDAFIRTWGVIPLDISRALAGDPRVSQGVLLTLVTALFLHGGWLHLGSNMLFLWVFGDNVEDRFGHVRYLLFYLICGVGANLAQVYVGPDSRIPLIGASGAIAAVLGAYLLMFPRARVTVLVPVFFLPLIFPVPAFLMLGVWLITQLANGLASITAETQALGGVGWWAHIGGFVLGALVTPFIPKARRREEVYRPLVAAPPREIRRFSPLGGLMVRAVTLVGDAISLLLTLRIVFSALDVAPTGIFDLGVRLLYAVTWPLVEPFTDYIPYLLIGGRTIELYSIVALLVYYVLVAVLAWVLALLLGGRGTARS
jgi:membrane associated rhomboid family serine protease